MRVTIRCINIITAVNSDTIWASSSSSKFRNYCFFCYLGNSIRENIRCINTIKTINSDTNWTRPVKN